eukprot:c15697_g1_i1.p1 GENE.c15697_g1_i1~~c15697_g1_i1.p1  ORF type:complete len:472 (+),score=152.66 c15697_g1_i1:17-1432(+)
MQRKLVLGVTAAFAIRVLLFVQDVVPLTQILMHRVELSSPTFAFHKAVEAAMRVSLGIDPYAGKSAFRQPPILLVPLLTACPFPLNSTDQIATRTHCFASLPHKLWLQMFFVVADLCVGVALYLVCSRHSLPRNTLLEKKPAQHPNTPSSSSPPSQSTIESPATELDQFQPASESAQQRQSTSVNVALWYLLNPVSIMSCVSLSLSVLPCLALVLACLAAVSGRSVLSGWLFGLCVCVSSHTLLVSPALVALLLCAPSPHSHSISIAISIVRVVGWAVGMGCVCVVLHVVAHAVATPSHFMHAVYGHGYTVYASDNTPGLTLFWYPGLLAFEEFEGCFSFLFQFQTLAFVVALLLSAMRKHALFCTSVVIMSVVLFKPYTTAGEIAFASAFLGRHHYLVTHTRHTFLGLNVVVFCVVLVAVLWELWVSTCLGNPNFFFAAVVAAMAALVLLLVDVLQARARIDHVLAHHLT